MAQAQLARTTTDSRAAARSFASLKDDEGGVRERRCQFV